MQFLEWKQDFQIRNKIFQIGNKIFRLETKFLIQKPFLSKNISLALLGHHKISSAVQLLSGMIRRKFVGIFVVTFWYRHYRKITDQPKYLIFRQPSQPVKPLVECREKSWLGKMTSELRDHYTEKLQVSRPGNNIKYWQKYFQVIILQLSLYFLLQLARYLPSYSLLTAVWAGNDTFLTEDITEDRKRFITQSKHMIF